MAEKRMSLNYVFLVEGYYALSLDRTIDKLY